jgi:hypothetical protein
VRFSAGFGLSENSVHEGSQVNAERHTLWQATITATYGAGIATQIGNAHEENPGVDLSVRSFSGAGAMEKADQSIDLLNNQIGRSIGEANPGASMSQLAGATLDYFHNTGLYTATPGANGSVTINQTRISDQQYQNAQNALKKMDNNGQQK